MIKTPIWNIGGGIRHGQNLINYFIDQKQFYDTTHKLFNYVYDSIFGLKWNGGRVCMPEHTKTLKDLFAEISTYNDLGVGFNWSFTNLLLTPEDLNDEYCNLVLEATNNSLNGVILTSDILREHVRKNYSNMRIIYSVCNGLKTIDQYKKALDENDIVVLHPDFNHNYPFLTELADVDGANRMEIMVNDVCSFGCPFREQHYKNLSIYNKVQSTCPIIHDKTELDYGSGLGCLAVRNGYNKDHRNKLSFTDLDYMLDLGFQHFKLIGREHEWQYYYDVDLRPNLEQYWARKLVQECGQHLHI